MSLLTWFVKEQKLIRKDLLLLYLLLRQRTSLKMTLRWKKWVPRLRIKRKLSKRSRLPMRTRREKTTRKDGEDSFLFNV